MSPQQAAANVAHLEELRLVCSWCNKVLKEGTKGAPTSHGMCESCQQDFETDNLRTGRHSDGTPRTPREAAK